jgi:hypothetical protein
MGVGNEDHTQMNTPPRKTDKSPRTPPPAPKKPRREDAIKERISEAVAQGEVYADEDAIFEELVADRNWLPTDDELVALVNKHGFASKNRCIECHVDMGIMNPRQYCCKSYCGAAAATAIGVDAE